MTNIMYECSGTDGETLKTAILAEAKQFVQKHGGKYKLVNEEHKSSCEGYAKKGYRKPNSRT